MNTTQALYTGGNRFVPQLGENRRMDFLAKWHGRALQAYKDAKQDAKDTGGNLTYAVLADKYNGLVDKTVDAEDAARQHVTPGQINHWLHGRRSPRLVELDRLCKIMKWAPETILFGIATKDSDEGYVKRSEVAAMVTNALQAHRRPQAPIPAKRGRTAKVS